MGEPEVPSKLADVLWVVLFAVLALALAYWSARAEVRVDQLEERIEVLEEGDEG